MRKKIFKPKLSPPFLSFFSKPALFILVSFAIILILLTSGISRAQTLSSASEDKNEVYLKELLDGEILEKGQGDNFRDSTQKDAVLKATIGLGLQKEYQNILKTKVYPFEKILDSIFDFNLLLIKKGFILIKPPVTIRAGESLKINENSLFGQKESYKILRPAKIILSPPNFRDYLYLDFAEVEEIHPSLYPQNASEKKLWQKRVQEGLLLGSKEAHHLFEDNLNLLTRDYLGLLNSLKLMSLKLMEQPVLNQSGSLKEISQTEIIFEPKSYSLEKRADFVK
jgi:defect-in-organelle-trafficking protein DotC